VSYVASEDYSFEMVELIHRYNITQSSDLVTGKSVAGAAVMMKWNENVDPQYLFI